MLRNATKGLVAIALCGGMLVSGGVPAGALNTGNGEVSAVSLADTSNLIYLSEPELKEIGLTKYDAEQLTSEVMAIIEKEKAAGNISEEDANAFSGLLLESPMNESGTQVRALPIWAAAAIVGCAGSVALGEGKDQVKNALKEGKSVDEASDIAIGVAVDCVFGAIPGGAAGAAVKNTLTKPIKDSLRPHVKKVVADMEKRYKNGEF